MGGRASGRSETFALATRNSDAYSSSSHRAAGKHVLSSISLVRSFVRLSAERRATDLPTAELFAAAGRREEEDATVVFGRMDVAWTAAI